MSNKMIIYNPHNNLIINERIKEAEALLNQVPAKYCFITGSFLFKDKYKDIDLFVISRTKKRIMLKSKKVKITVIDFNNTGSLFYHSISKSCIAKNILPKRQLKVTISDYWHTINEAVPTLLNQKNKFHKNVRFLVLYTEYFKTGEVMDTFQLRERINLFKGYKDVLLYIKREVPQIICKNVLQSYAKRFFYTNAGYYKGLREYAAQNFLYDLAHDVVRGVVHG